mmetsp:Transcript_12857/g.25445  ORF Transcript_12857/g.25445 Transcript_12857/m.25445 type:complete len:303 (-) Transcript_12857:285-1193(-)
MSLLCLAVSSCSLRIDCSRSDTSFSRLRSAESRTASAPGLLFLTLRRDLASDSGPSLSFRDCSTDPLAASIVWISPSTVMMAAWHSPRRRSASSILRCSARAVFSRVSLSRVSISSWIALLFALSRSQVALTLSDSSISCSVRWRHMWGSAIDAGCLTTPASLHPFSICSASLSTSSATFFCSTSSSSLSLHCLRRASSLEEASSTPFIMRRECLEAATCSLSARSTMSRVISREGRLRRIARHSSAQLSGSLSLALTISARDASSSSRDISRITDSSCCSTRNFRSSHALIMLLSARSEVW